MQRRRENDFFQKFTSVMLSARALKRSLPSSLLKPHLMSEIFLSPLLLIRMTGCTDPGATSSSDPK